MASELHKFEVGQTLFLKDVNRKGLEAVTVTKVGRKWVTLSGGWKLDPETLRVQSNYTPPTVWFSREEYEASRLLDRCWKAFAIRAHRHYSPPPGVTVDDIRKAAALLRIEVPDAE